jgi:kynurenine formamidase/threonine dehydrogenase-like Zn-dependent dehydrogenase
MRAMAVFPAHREVRIVEEPEPAAPGPGEVLLRVRDVGICGTDREICAFEYGEVPEGRDRLIIGHEALAEVASVGPEVQNLAPGDLVVPMVRRPCLDRTCVPCRLDRADFCTSGGFRERGIKQLDGFLRERLVEEERYLVPVPRPVESVAVLVEPLTIIAKAAAQVEAAANRLPWRPLRRRSLVLGAGPVGLLGAMMFVARGFQTFVYSREPASSPQAALATSFGATYLSSSETPIDRVPERAGGPMDGIFEAVGVSTLAFQAIDALGPNGVLVLSGVPALGPPRTLDADRVMRQLVLANQLVVGTVSAGRAAYAAAIRELQLFESQFPEALHRLISHRVSLDEAPQTIAGHKGVKQVVAVARRQRGARAADGGKRRWIDVTVPIHDDMVHFPGDPAVRVETSKDLARGDNCRVSSLTLGTHTGTHVDAPAHFLLEGKGIDEVLADAMVGEARVLEVEAAGAIDPAALARHEPQAGERILLKTRNSDRWGTDEFAGDYVYLGTEAARYLVERGVRTVGIDYLSIGGGSDGVQTHRELLAAGICIIEGLDLSQVSAGPCELMCLPLRIAHGDGAPARALVRSL